MTVTKTAKQKIRRNCRHIDATIAVYREAEEYLNRVVLAEWPNLAPIQRSKHRINYLEKLVHSTNGNKAVYTEFDRRFYKFPSYLRRQAISRAIGHVSSHLTRCRQWEENGRKGRQPAFQPKCYSFPVLYKGNVFTWCSNGNAMVKLFNGREWLWYHIPFEPIDIYKRFPSEEGWQRQNPMLVKKNKRWSLHFPFEKNVALRDKDFIRPVLAVDLGLTTTAVCSVVRSDGTVTHREFISYGGEKDRLNDTLGRIAVKSALTFLIPEGESFCGNHWRVVRNLTEEIAHQCSANLVNLAVKYNCQTIVFEHLGRLRVPRDFYGAGRLRRKVHYWLQGRIQKYTKYKGYANGIRFSRVLARGTSRYAYDGSGKVHRIGNQQIAVFSGGQKIYNADLNASYNIAARYWIREYLSNTKSLGRKAQVVIRDQSSLLAVRHLQVLASLISLVRLLHRKRSAHVPYPSQHCSQKETPTITASAV